MTAWSKQFDERKRMVYVLEWAGYVVKIYQNSSAVVYKDGTAVQYVWDGDLYGKCRQAALPGMNRARMRRGAAV